MTECTNEHYLTLGLDSNSSGYALTGLVITPVRAENPSQCVQLHMQSVSGALG